MLLVTWRGVPASPGTTLTLNSQLYWSNVQEAKRKAKEELERKRNTMIFMMVTGKNFLEGDAELFEGLSPKEINEMAAARIGSPYINEDPFDVSCLEEWEEGWGLRA